MNIAGLIAILFFITGIILFIGNVTGCHKLSACGFPLYDDWKFDRESGEGVRRLLSIINHKPKIFEMNNNVIAWVGWLLLVSAPGFYVYGIYEAIHLSWSTTPIGKDAYHPVLSTTVGSIQALLLANLGILLGISIAKPDSNVAKQMMLGKQAAAQSPLDIRDKVQLFALVLYIISLIVCLLTWIKKDFSLDPKDVVSVVPESGKMFIGVVLAYLTAVLRK